MRESGIDHEIELEKVNKKDIEVLWGPLYNISREELLVLRKELIKLLNKRFIKMSKSVIKVPVLFIYKLGRGF